ncbi:MAG: glycosyltransferase [Dehalococcoidales bacterium]|nr:glycosyltransferase [Dehalococcoidales bacterium]
MNTATERTVRRVLIISRYHGTRVPGLLKYLPDFGWQPTLLTTVSPEDLPMPKDIKAIETPCRDALGPWKKLFKARSAADLRSRIKQNLGDTSRKSFLDRLLTWLSEIINYPDSYKGWKKYGIRAGEELFQRESYDAIVSSSAPVTAHIIAGAVKNRHDVPWVADLRDPWSQNHNYSYSDRRKKRDRRLEIQTLATANTLVTVSAPWAKNLGTLHAGKPVHAITNGFDPELAGPAEQLTPKFTITYTGNIYTGMQNPSRLFGALRSLIDAGDMDPRDIEVRFYGPEPAWLPDEIDAYGLTGVVTCHGRVPADTAIRKQKESHVLWLMDWDAPEERGVYPLKVFEYLGAERPVLATGGIGGNVIEQLLYATRAGIHALNEEATRNALLEMYHAYKATGSVPYHGDNTEIARYSQREMAREFAEILDGLRGTTS